MKPNEKQSDSFIFRENKVIMLKLLKIKEGIGIFYK